MRLYVAFLSVSLALRNPEEGSQEILSRDGNKEQRGG